MEISYSKVGDYFLPNLVLPEEEKTIGKSGRMRKRHVLQVLFHLGTAAHASDDVLLACICHNQRHHRFIPFLLSKQPFFL